MSDETSLKRTPRSEKIRFAPSSFKEVSRPATSPSASPELASPGESYMCKYVFIGFAPFLQHSPTVTSWRTARSTSRTSRVSSSNNNNNNNIEPANRGNLDGNTYSRHCATRKRGRGGVVVTLLASHLGEPDSIPEGVTPGSSHVEIVPDDAAGRRVFSEISRFPRHCIPALLPTHLNSHPSALKTSIFSADTNSINSTMRKEIRKEGSHRSNSRKGGVVVDTTRGVSGWLPTCKAPHLQLTVAYLAALISLYHSSLYDYTDLLHCREHVDKLLTSRLGKPGSITSGVAHEFSHVGIVPDYATGRWVFFRYRSFTPPLHSGAVSYSPRFTLIGSQDLDVISHPYISTPLK
ncbi:hypothetical protein PR048_009486 [Dryococelus australis]|uniref:Uncharacterized protein n=1 Tax=Dryococelus australis TaxID=614101 RepID=A0ABQ9I004_9NEOP|nr:hypothetical protein PR048_009486 [Dryococelus australis]